MTYSDPSVPVRYQALSVEAAASKSLSTSHSVLRVHSVFPSTMNLEIEGTDEVIALRGRSGRAYPHAVVLEPPVDFRDWRIPPGGRARLTDGLLHLEGTAGCVIVDLSLAQRPPARSLPLISKTGGAFRACVDRLIESQAAKGSDLSVGVLLHGGRATTALGNELCGAALDLGAASRAFLRSQRSTSACPPGPSGQDPEPLQRAVAALVGLGAGLTPSGDDFFCGYLAATRACDSGPIEVGCGLSLPLNEAVEANLGRTGSLSAALVRCALRNFWPGPLVDLAEALAGKQEGAALRALDDLLLLGHSSGSDLATGFLFGLEVLLGAAALC